MAFFLKDALRSAYRFLSLGNLKITNKLYLVLFMPTLRILLHFSVGSHTSFMHNAASVFVKFLSTWHSFHYCSFRCMLSFFVTTPVIPSIIDSYTLFKFLSSSLVESIFQPICSYFSSSYAFHYVECHTLCSFILAMDFGSVLIYLEF